MKVSDRITPEFSRPAFLFPSRGDVRLWDALPFGPKSTTSISNGPTSGAHSPTPWAFIVTPVKPPTFEATLGSQFES